ncbi:MAG TPA: FtsX-like permease family protein, partial [Caldilineaceae bacterium]|nr:FtsX-like permease family protein [Caldilineaceae bacterium]
APWSNYLTLRQYIQTTLDNSLGLPRQTMMHYVKSDLFQFFPVLAGTYERANDPLSRVYVGFVSGLYDHIQLREGSLPATTWNPGEPFDVLVSASFAEKLGLQVGERYVLFNVAGLEGATQSFSAPVRIAGVWQATDPRDPFWYIPPSAFDETLLVAPELYLQFQGDQLPRPLYDVGWYMAYDGGSIHAEEVDNFLARVSSVQSRVGALLPGTRLGLSPVAALQRYQVTVAAQSVLILVLGLPIIGLILLFIALVASSVVERQRLEIAILKSRGSSSGQVAALFLWQGLALSVLALVVGLPAGWLAAEAMGSTRQFLVFERATPLNMAITPTRIRYAVGAVLLALIVTVTPAIAAARLTVVAAKQRVGRPIFGPLWWSLGGDLLLLLCAGYAYYLLAGQQGFARLMPGEQVDPWQNPLLFIAPALFLLAGAQLYRHLLPLVLRLCEWVAAWLPSVALLLSLRNLARNAEHYGSLLALLLLTTGLGAYVTSFARTADENLVARTYYRIGANLVVTEGAGMINRGAVSL